MNKSKLFAVLIFLAFIGLLTLLFLLGKNPNKKPDYTLEFVNGNIYLTNVTDNKLYIIPYKAQRPAKLEEDFGYAIQVAIENDNQ